MESAIKVQSNLIIVLILGFVLHVYLLQLFESRNASGVNSLALSHFKCCEQLSNCQLVHHIL